MSVNHPASNGEQAIARVGRLKQLQQHAGQRSRLTLQWTSMLWCAGTRHSGTKSREDS